MSVLITHDQLIFTICNLLNLPISDHGVKFWVGMEISSSGEQISPAKIYEWEYENIPVPDSDKLIEHWNLIKSEFYSSRQGYGLTRIEKIKKLEKLISDAVILDNKHSTEKKMVETGRLKSTTLTSEQHETLLNYLGDLYELVISEDGVEQKWPDAPFNK